jgi:hypothetical protein
MTTGVPYRLRCTLTFGDIYGQILIWMLVIFVSLAAGLALMGASKPLFALVGVGLILVLSLPRLHHHAAEPHRPGTRHATGLSTVG